MEFCQAKASDQSGAQREAMLKDLAAGFDMFMELKNNLEEGTKVNHCNIPVTNVKMPVTLEKKKYQLNL